MGASNVSKTVGTPCILNFSEPRLATLKFFSSSMQTYNAKTDCKKCFTKTF